MGDISFGRTRRGRWWRDSVLGSASLRLLPLALVAGLVGAVGPAMADEPAAELVPTERAMVLRHWENGGPAVKAAAAAALLAGDAEVTAFLASGRLPAEVQDNQVQVARIQAAAGPGVQEAAHAALNGTAEDLRYFLGGGWEQALVGDQQLQVSQMLNGADPGLQAAGRKALNGSVEELRKFLAEGQFAARDADDRVKLVQLFSIGGPNTQAAARLALNGTIDDVREFLKVGQHVARARDAERTSVAQLVQQAKEASAQAVRENEAAKAASAQAVAAAKQAKEDAALAAAETQAAQQDTSKAGAAAERAAEASTRAAGAAQTAIQAARAAGNTARTAASAAAQAAYAAGGAEQAAARARRAAAAAATDRSKAALAAEAARDAEAVAIAVETAGKALDEAVTASARSEDAADAAYNAGSHALAAAGSAEQAGGFASQATSQSAKAKQAAAATRRHAQEATRSATAAKALAKDAGQAAAESKTYAVSAAAHARAAAQAAADAAQHATEAGQAAAVANAHATEAKNAAAKAKEATERATQIQDLARRAEAEELASRTAAAVEKARDAKAAFEDERARAGQAVQEVRQVSDEAARLAAALAQPNPDNARIVTDGRKLALLSMQIAGTWEAAAARTALSGTDAAVLEFVRTGRQKGIALDERARVASLAGESEMPAVRSAAATALQGDGAAVRTFLATGQYAAATADYQVTVAQSMNDAGPGVQAAARAALNAGTVDALREYLGGGRFAAQIADDQVTAAQLRNGAGPELDAAARVALESPPQALHAFTATGQYIANRKDQLAATHVADVQRLIAEGAAATALAEQAAAEAAYAAAEADNAHQEAANWAAQAQQSAQTAATYSTQAQEKARQAETSANQAAQAAKSATAAQESAQKDAARADYSSFKAEKSAQAARGSAKSAYSAAAAARASAAAAGQDAKAAAEAAIGAYEAYGAKALAEYVAQMLARELELRDPVKQAQQEADDKKTVDDAAKGKGRPGDKDGWDWNADWDWLSPVQRVLEFYGNAYQWMFDKYTDFYGTLFPLLGSVGSFFSTLVLDTAPTLFAEGSQCLWGKITGDAKSKAPQCQNARDAVGEQIDKFLDIGVGDKSVRGLIDKFGKFLNDHLPDAIRCRIPHSFPAGTEVLLADGSTRPIELVRTGDEVLATDPESGRTGGNRVEATILTPDDRDFTELTVRSPGRTTGTLTATDNHPFWSDSRKAWLAAADLKPGDSLRTTGGRTATVDGATHRQALQPAYNLTVQDIHTYYVLAGGTPVLVHNQGPPPPQCGPHWYRQPYGGNLMEQGTTATINDDGVVEMTIRAPDRPGVPAGGDQFTAAMQFFGDQVKGVRGLWDGSRDLRSNLDKFNELLRSNPLLSNGEAARGTFTGKMAGRDGWPHKFTRVEVVELVGTRGNYTSVEVIFWPE
ncbi:polymorphic toxin-type HINT domain-containing protein [Kitasatospora sp. NPDC058218]|uniref:polymorphic toxin-type HINT domain-containing protein n=1 Tax=Kitasatospora sp. NPDC058218 TaxID=3346385 RepID=UPI0036DEE95F